MMHTIELTVEKAKGGDKDALVSLVRQLQDRVFGLAMRMLGNPADAEDASQEILIRTVTHLSTYRQESSFNSWAYRIAANYLHTARKRASELRARSFDQHEMMIDQHMGTLPGRLTAEEKLMEKEIRLGCLHGLLLALDRNLRLTYILGDVYGVSGLQGAYILSISGETFRKRLSRARERLYGFLSRNCAMFNGRNRCHCSKWIAYMREHGYRGPAHLRFSNLPQRIPDVSPRSGGEQDALSELEKVAVLFRRQTEYATPQTLADELRSLLSTERLEMLMKDA